MTNGFENLFLLAKSSRLRAMGSGLRGRRAQIDTGDLITVAIVFAAIVLGVVLLSRFTARQDKRRSFNSPRALFRGLIKAHDVNRHGRRLLHRIARRHRLGQPAQLFVEPARFDLKTLGQDLQKEGPAITALRERLFGETQKPTTNS